MIEIVQEDELNPVDMYIGSLGGENSMCTMRGALCGTARVMAREGMIKVDPETINFETVREIQWHKLTNPQLDKIRGMLVRNFEPAGAMLKLAAIIGVIERAARAGMIDVNEYYKIRKVEKIKVYADGVGRSLTIEEIEKLFAACNDDPTIYGRRDKAIIATAVFAGPRRNELVRLKISDYSFTDGSVYIEHGKNKRKRHTYMGADGRAIVDTTADEPLSRGFLSKAPTLSWCKRWWGMKARLLPLDTIDAGRIAGRLRLSC